MSTDPQRTEYRLMEKNIEEEQNSHQPCFNLFVPYTTLGADKAGRELSKEHFSLRSALRRYLFVKGDEAMLEASIREWNKAYNDKTFFLRSDAEHHARISQHDMEMLKQACGNEQVKLDLPLLLSDLQVGKEIPLAGTPFDIKDATYKLLAVKRRRGGIVELQVELTIFNVTFQNLFVTYLDPADRSSSANLVVSAQKKLLDIFRRKVNGHSTIVSDHEDAKTLQSLFQKRDTPFPDGAMKRHFLALMLICSHLMRQEEETRRFISAVQQELAEIAKLRESKAATDTRAYLHVALYIATGEPQYRQQAKTYITKYQPSSPYLRQFVSTSAKRQASKYLGTKYRKQ